MRNADRIGESGKWRTRRFVLYVALVTSPLSLIQSPLPSAAQQIDDSEIPTAISSRTLPLRFEHLTINDGLTQNTVHHVMQDRHGFMWFTTQAGLNRFDGYDVKTYENMPFDSTSAPDAWLFGMAEDTAGAIWIGTLNQGVARFDPVAGKFEFFRHDPDDSTTIGHDITFSALVDSRGTVWITGFGGLCRHKGGRAFECFGHDPSNEASVSSDSVWSVVEDQAGRILVATAQGIDRMDAQRAGNFERIADWAGSILERPEEPGVLWVGRPTGELRRLDVESGEVETYPALSAPISDMVQDPVSSNVIWVASQGDGFGRFDLRSKTFLKYLPDPGDPEPVTDKAIWGLNVDRSGTIWVGTQNSGVVRFNPTSVGFAHIRHDPSNPNSLQGSSVWSIVQEPDGVLWITTSPDRSRFRVTRIDRADGVVTNFEKDSDPWLVTLVDRAGTVWVSHYDLGLGTYDPAKGTFEYRYRHDPDDESTISNNFIPSMHEDDAGFLWLGTMGGLDRLDPRTGQVERMESVRLDQFQVIESVFEDRNGSLWLPITGLGLARFDPVTRTATWYLHDPDDTSSLSSKRVSDAIERRQEPGIIWVATTGGGLDRLDVSTGKFTHFTVGDGLPNNVVYRILEDDRGDLWMSTNRGISRFDPETGQFRNFGLESGVQALEFNSRASHKGPRGELFFGGINGVNAFFPNELLENSRPPELAIVDLKLENQSIRETHAITLDGPIEDAKEIRLGPDQRDLRIDYVAFHYEHPELTEFAYKLEGFNEDWVSAGQERSAAYTNLDPGEYTFRVKAANSDGVWNEEGVVLHVLVEPPFWATWWFRILALIGLTGVLYLSYAARVRQVEARARKLEGEIEKRTVELKRSNTQLEQSHTIVEAINRETSFTRLLTKILEEARVIPGVEKATALVYSHDEDRYYVRASSGWDIEAMKGIRLTKKGAHDRYVLQAEEVADDIFIAKNVAEREGTEQMAEFGNVASFLVVRIEVDGDTAGYLVFDNVTNPDAFDQRDVDLLVRLREHIQSAFIKTNILEDLQTTLNNLQSTQNRLLQSEKMASLGELTAGIAHEIKNPLNFVNNFSETSSELLAELESELAVIGERVPEENREQIAAILSDLRMTSAKVAEHGKRADGIVQNMLEHSKIGEGQRTPTDLNSLLDEYVTLASHGLRAKDPDFDVHVDRNYDDRIGQVDIVPQDMGRVFMNLLANAFDALREHDGNGRQPTVTVSTQAVDQGIEIRVADNGPGIPEKVKSKIFEPFFTTKPTGSATGLGLSMSYDIVTKGHGGSLEVESELGKGATFIVKLPT